MPNAIFDALRVHRDLDQLVRVLPRALQPVLDFDYMSLFLDRKVARGATWYVPHGEDQPSLTLTPTREIPIEAVQASWVLEHQQPAVIPRLEQDTQFLDAKRLLRERGFQSACALPLTTAHRRLGSLNIAATRAYAYAESDVRFLSDIADQVAVALDNALSHAELQDEQDRLKLLLELTNSVVSNLNLHEVLSAVMRTSRCVMRSDSAVVLLPDASRGQLRACALDFPGGKEILQEGELIPLDGTVAGHVFRTGKPWVGYVDDLPKTGPEVSAKWSAKCSVSGFKVGCVLPLISRNRVLGTLELRRRDENAYTDDEVQFLMQVANQIAIAVENALAYGEIRALKDKLALEKLYLEDEIRSEGPFEDIIGKSTALRRVLRQVETVASTDATVLIYGETGTGKELIARAVHNLSPRHPQAFVKLNCAAIPTGLVESELFGHERGAFTGAIAQRIGRFELANRGTVFLDEIADLPLELQPKLLRVLQEREFERLGNSRTLRSDARLIAATNGDLAAMVAAQRFRADLFYRLNVFPIHVPPLRERAEDIPLLVRHFVQHFARRMNRTIETISSDTMESLVRYQWPGNIRELENVIERAVILSSGSILKVPLEELQERVAPGRVNGTHRTLEEAERAHILATVKETKWVLSGPRGAATRLGMNRSTLQFRMKKLGIVRPA
jgi:formate hydrogenlyase transcriptional activator